MSFTFKDPLPSLCSSCEYVSITTMSRGSAYIRCRMLDRDVHGDVAECSVYAKVGAMDKHQMERVAWTIKTGASGEVIGFKAPGPRKDDYL